MGMMWMMVVLPIMLSIMFFTLMEIQMLGSSHARKGPNHVGVIGVLQPLGDFMKLFSKHMWIPPKSDKMFYMYSPMLCLLVGMMIWPIYTSNSPISNIKWSTMTFFCLSSLLVYYLLFSGWASGSSFSLLGSFRSAAQTISYEVCMMFIIIMTMNITKKMSMWESSKMMNYQMMIFQPIIMIMWMYSCLAESNRTPLDLSEGESELVSGFNTEYAGGFFSFIFITEYGFMIFLSFMTTLFFLSENMFWMKQMMMMMFFIVTRASFPRMRFDIMMKVMWKKFSVVILSAFILSMMM